MRSRVAAGQICVAAIASLHARRCVLRRAALAQDEAVSIWHEENRLILSKRRKARVEGRGMIVQPTVLNPDRVSYLVAIGIFFCCVTACAVFGSVTLSTPFSKLAAIFARSTLSGSPKLRWKEP